MQAQVMDPTTMEENTSFLAKSYAPCGTDNEGRGIMWITGSTYTILYIYLRRYIYILHGVYTCYLACIHCDYESVCVCVHACVHACVSACVCMCMCASISGKMNDAISAPYFCFLSGD